MADEKGDAQGSPGGVPPFNLLTKKKRTRIQKINPDRPPNELYIRALLGTVEEALVGKLFRRTIDYSSFGTEAVLVTHITIVPTHKSTFYSLQVHFIKNEKEASWIINELEEFYLAFVEVENKL